MNVRNPDITGPCHHLKTGARIRAQHEHLKNITTHPALTGEGGRQDRPPITNISPALIGNVPGEILTLQSLSRKLDDLERTLFRIKTYGSLLALLATIISLFFGALRINWHELRAILPWPS